MCPYKTNCCVDICSTCDVCKSSIKGWLVISWLVCVGYYVAHAKFDVAQPIRCRLVAFLLLYVTLRCELEL